MRKGSGQVKSTTLYSPVLLSISQTFISKNCKIIIQGSEIDLFMRTNANFLDVISLALF